MKLNNSPERLREIFKGDDYAVDLLLALARISHAWDDLIDRDGEIADSEINWAFWASMVYVPSNPFYQKHRGQLIPLMDMFALNYIAANDLERGDLHDREIAYNARFQLGDIAITIARILGGFEWASKHAAELKRMANDTDMMADYLAELEDKYGTPA